MPLLLIPAALGVFGTGWAVGNWTAGGWLKWLFILVLVVLAWSAAKKMGIIK